MSPSTLSDIQIYMIFFIFIIFLRAGFSKCRFYLKTKPTHHTLNVFSQTNFPLILDPFCITATHILRAGHKMLVSAPRRSYRQQCQITSISIHQNVCSEDAS